MLFKKSARAKFREQKQQHRSNHLRSLFTRNHPKSVISEQFRTLRTNLQFAPNEVDLQTIAVTSTNKGEGKSVTAINLATVFAQQGKQVLLVDADMRSPSIHHNLRIDNRLGLSNLLVGDYDVVQVVRDVKTNNLDILTCGPIPPNPSELLDSQAMTELMEKAKASYDLIIFDTPPVLAVTDPQILANRVDGVLFVVRSKVTDKKSATKARELLKQADANILGAVLNDYDQKRKDYYYYSYQ
ncbi:CpsD/CapB family tyrosine-protein kinase [Alkalibacillus haloalkaliphilus]|uniref:CpsD/CapB family tyrosine-protein kinase n=1 Tax=Alkalibacillus haloalkaliphilus TaxID=94136 RepID=UPI0038994B4D